MVFPPVLLLFLIFSQTIDDLDATLTEDVSAKCQTAKSSSEDTFGRSKVQFKHVSPLKQS